MILKQWINMVLIKFIKNRFDKSWLWLNTDRGEWSSYLMISLLDSVFLKLEMDELPWYHNGWSAGSTQSNYPEETVISWPVPRCDYGTALDWSVLDTSCWSGTLSQYPSSAWFIWNLFSFPPENVSLQNTRSQYPPSGKLEGGKKIDVGQS